MNKVRILPGRLMRWGGFALHRDESTDTFRARSNEFEWEVDASMDDSDEYEARVSYKGVKVASGAGSPRVAALDTALKNLVMLSEKVHKEVALRVMGQGGNKNHKA